MSGFEYYSIQFGNACLIILIIALIYVLSYKDFIQFSSRVIKKHMKLLLQLPSLMTHLLFAMLDTYVVSFSVYCGRLRFIIFFEFFKCFQFCFLFCCVLVLFGWGKVELDCFFFAVLFVFSLALIVLLLISFQRLDKFRTHFIVMVCL